MRNDELKKAVIEAVQKEIEVAGEFAKFGELRKDFPEVKKASFYRWVNKAKESGKNGVKGAAKILEATKKQPRKRKAGKRAAGEIVNELAVPVLPEDIVDLGFGGAIARVNQCMGHADEVLAMCKTDEGKLRNPKLYLHASAHLMRSLEAAARVAQVMMNAQKVEEFHQIILNRIKDRDPEVVEMIIQDLRQLNQQWSV